MFDLFNILDSLQYFISFIISVILLFIIKQIVLYNLNIKSFLFIILSIQLNYKTHYLI